MVNFGIHTIHSFPLIVPFFLIKTMSTVNVVNPGAIVPSSGTLNSSTDCFGVVNFGPFAR